MAGPPHKQTLFIDGPAGRLEAIVETPKDAVFTGAAVVCHPHPQHGGTMHNKVAHQLARAFLKAGFAVLRFNFRGTEASEGTYDEGVGEVDDVLAALQWMRERSGREDVWLAGFSFGAAVSVKAAVQTQLPGLVSIAPAVSRFARGLDRQPDCPWLILIGDKDELVDVNEMIGWVDTLAPGPELLVMPDAEHFFHGRLVELRDHVVDFVTRSAQNSDA
ncbi:MAG: alpha/beta fold hydrolase [Pseudomonadota bacterium]